jgi:hypothetical protein
MKSHKPKKCPHNNKWKCLRSAIKVAIFLPLLKMIFLCSTVQQSSIFSCSPVTLNVQNRLCGLFFQCFPHNTLFFFSLNSQPASKQSSLQWMLLIEILSKLVHRSRTLPHFMNSWNCTWANVLLITMCQVNSKSHCHWRSVSQSWYRDPSGAHAQISSCFTVTALSTWGALPDERTSLSFVKFTVSVSIRIYILAHIPVAKWWLCKQRPLLYNARNTHISNNRRTVVSIWSVPRYYKKKNLNQKISCWGEIASSSVEGSDVK